MQREGSELVLGPFCTLGALLLALVRRSRATAAPGHAAPAADRRLPLARKLPDALAMNRPGA